MTWRTWCALQGYMDVACGNYEGLTAIFEAFGCNNGFAPLICYLEGVVDAYLFRLQRRPDNETPTEKRPVTHRALPRRSGRVSPTPGETEQ